MKILEIMEQDVICSVVGHIGAAPIPSCSQNRCASNPHSCPTLTKNYTKSITWDARTDSNCDFAYIRCSLGYKPSVLTIERRAHNFSFITSIIKIFSLEYAIYFLKQLRLPFRHICKSLVDSVRLELTSFYKRNILSVMRLPISPRIHTFGAINENRTRI